uniref:PPIase cyclophilin-type domain-containing protein n=1 Tax=Chromera velia CCMP2878 TaxID=1169474 RepID=A0A0G4IDC4_9ALVE|mmetsp:Transcript_9823/g.19017  ORF Transcript_9823/g.19017 Transcript_9823/m.19017 type:complete len:421 (-) Transcript_9823:20-1282(-)|eukprot:Cvel_13362.t1-p1 / transcript=Cvel_13362.t1 / gene=Cvel_13362 / organism=Chromera_velia_CCMP2878 / gene_product=Peptidyl-prolyl cis-trans isomerase B, putative / transcript_product=Peptidyl-prolyl cis-trans isomerase B, putative / location=Cvel_scaffold908:49157-52064(+) / protein_length=420 / sequence_SO=supercontig / SO=protein_coding / is_pseudo=false
MGLIRRGVTFAFDVIWRTPFAFKVMLGVPFVGLPSFLYYQEYSRKQQRNYLAANVTEKVYMDFAIGNRYVGRVLIGLYGNLCPMAVENFIQLCEGYKVGDKKIGYKNTLIHAIQKDLCLTGGDVITGVGSHGLSIFGSKFPDENFDVPFIQDGDVAMFSTGPHSNNSQFIITFTRALVLYGHCMVVGTVLKGMRIIRMIEELSTQTGRPSQTVRVVGCGMYKEAEHGPSAFPSPQELEPSAPKTPALPAKPFERYLRTPENFKASLEWQEKNKKIFPHKPRTLTQEEFEKLSEREQAEETRGHIVPHLKIRDDASPEMKAKLEAGLHSNTNQAIRDKIAGVDSPAEKAADRLAEQQTLQTLQRIKAASQEDADAKENLWKAARRSQSQRQRGEASEEAETLESGGSSGEEKEQRKPGWRT